MLNNSVYDLIGKYIFFKICILISLLLLLMFLFAIPAFLE